MNKIDFEKLEYEIRDSFCKYQSECAKVKELLIKKFPKEKEKILDVLCQEGDGVVVLYDEQLSLNIPLIDFLNGERCYGV